MFAAIAASMALAAGITWASSSDSKDVSQGSTLPTAAEAMAAFQGVPQRGLALGRRRAPVTVVVFVDLQCPYCRQFELDALPRLIDKHVRRGDVRVEIRGLAFLGPDSERGLRAILAASRQGRAFELMELLYHNQGAENSGWVTDELIRELAAEIPGLDVDKLFVDAESDEVAAAVQQGIDQAQADGVPGTPTFFIAVEGEEPYMLQSGLTAEQMGAALDDALGT